MKTTIFSRNLDVIGSLMKAAAEELEAQAEEDRLENERAETLRIIEDERREEEENDLVIAHLRECNS